MFSIAKYLTWCCMPLSLVMIGMVALTIWLVCRKVWKVAIALGLLTIFLCVSNLPWVSMKLGTMLESEFPPMPIETIPQADAIVVLGGGIGATQGKVIYPECYQAADRVVMAARLYHAKKAPLIIPTGAGAIRSELPILEAMGVPASAIASENKSRNTEENALYTITQLRIRKCKTVLVVTSSWHLKRAMMLFNFPEIKFIPVGCDYEATLMQENWHRSPLWQKLPMPGAATQSVFYIKELLGGLYYSFKVPATTLKKLPASAPKKSISVE